MAETISGHDCSIVLSRVDGPAAREIFLHCRPPVVGRLDPGRQAVAMYRAILGALEAEGGGFRSVVAETIFLHNLAADIGAVRAARREVLAACDAPEHRPATLEIEQPPLDDRACLEVSVQAILPNAPSLRVRPVVTTPACPCAACEDAHGLQVHVDDETRFYAGGLCGPGDDAYEQTLGMFGLAEELLRRAGMEFRDVVRTWIYLRHMERDYGALNRARRQFFESRGIEPVPASTGIGGGLVPGVHDLCLGIYAVKAGRPRLRTVMTSPTLNDAGEYGADFVRGMKMVETNKVALHVSGTASIDENGNTVHRDDLEGQVDRMLVNIAALLERQGAGFADVVNAITYVKHPADAGRVREELLRAGFQGFPHAMVAATICRPDLLCETEVLAVLPGSATAG
jgi:enamine deaminase RidA (YjgF/YER057c/UK114 family)